MKPGARRFPPPLHISIPLLVFGFSCLFVVITSHLLSKRGEKRETDRQTTIGVNQAVRLSKTMTRPSGGDGAAFQDELEMLGGDAWLQWAAVSTTEGVIAYSTDPAQIGRPIHSVTSFEVGEAAEMVLAGRASQEILVDDKRIIVIQPITQTGGKSPRWLVLVKRDLTEVLARERHQWMSDTLFASVILFLFCLGLCWALHWFLTRRVRQLLKHINDPQMAATPSLEGSDEFAKISQSFWESESRLRQITDNIHDVFYMTSVQPRQLLYLSPAFEKIWGLKSDEVLAGSYSWLDHVFEEDKQTVMNLHERVHNGEEMVHCEYRIHHPDGTDRWLETKAFPVKDVHGEVYRVAGTTTDITERKELEQAILDISERERRGIGHDLHDDLCQRLAALKLRCEMMAHMLQEKEPVAPEMATGLGSQIGEAANLCRNIARGLSPVNLEGDGLMHALNELVQIAKSLYDVICYFQCPEPILMGNNNTATHLYRIAQELINNAARHAHPSRVYVRLTKEGHSVRLEVANDGSVFSEPEHTHEGMGLRIIRYRANAIGGTVQYLRRSSGQAGTVAICLVPESACNAP